MGNNAKFTITLETDGSVQVKQDQAAIAVAAEQSADRVVKAYDRTARAAEKAEQQRVDARRKAEQEWSRLTGIEQESAGSAGSAPSSTTSQSIGSLVDQRRYQASAQRLMDQLDPAAKFQRDFNTEMDRTNGLLSKGYISQAQYDAYVVKLKSDLAEATNGLREHGGMLGLNRMQYLTAQSAVLRFSDSIIAGQNPLRAMALEAHKVVEVLAMDEGGMGGGLAKLIGLINPATVSTVALTAEFAAAAAAAYSYEERLDRLSMAAEGFGRTSQLTGEQLAALATENAAAGHVSVKTAEDIETAILQQTRTSAAALQAAIQITQSFADAMGVDAKKAAEDLGKALADPAKGADELASRYGYLTQAQVEHVHQLMEENRLTEAQQTLLGGLKGELQGVEDHVNSLTKAWRWLADTMSQGWSDIGRAAAHAAGIYSDTEKAANLQHDIQRDQSALQSGWYFGAARTEIEAQLRKEQEDYAKLAGDQQRRTNDARSNQLGQQARDITARYSLDPTVNPKLEQLKQELSTMEAAQRAGQKVDGATLDALHHAVRTFMTPDQQRVAIQTAQADLRRAAPHSKAREEAGQRLKDAQTAGQVITESAANDLANERGLAALGHGKTGGDRHAESLARQAASMDVAAASSLKLADAYLASGAAALKAEAYRKAATDATRKGIDIDAQAERQLNLQVAEQVANSAKGIRSMEDETAARNRVIDAVRAGTVPAAEMEQALARENALRPLLTLQSVAHGAALEKLTEIIQHETLAMNDNEASLKRLAAQQAINAADDSARADRLRQKLAGVHDPVDRARQTALANAAAKEWSSDDAARSAAAAAGAASAKQSADSAEWLANEQHRVDLAMQMLRLQAAYSSAKDASDVDEIQRLQLLNQLDGQHITLSEQQVRQVLAQQKAEKDLSDQVQRQKAGYQQLRDEGASALDQLLNPDNIDHWGNTFHSVIRQILMDLEKLAVINPFENMLFGGNRAALGGGAFGSLFSSIFGGGLAALPDVGSLLDSIPTISAFASGTDNAPGGTALVGEYGPELVNLPHGAGVMTASETKAAFQSGAGGNTFHMPVTINAQGAGPREVDVLRLEINRLRRDIPTMAVQASNDARSRRVARA